MTCHGLPIPEALVELLDAGLWPRTPEEAGKQNLQPLVSAERIHEFALDEERIYLYAPPFGLVANAVKQEGVGKFYSMFCALHELRTDLALEIGDFGIGSDALILLDFQFDRGNPRVIRLRWDSGSRGQRNRWDVCADDFEQFAALLFG